MGSTGSAKPINFGRGVLEPVSFSWRKTEKMETLLLVILQTKSEVQNDRRRKIIPAISRWGVI